MRKSLKSHKYKRKSNVMHVVSPHTTCCLQCALQPIYLRILFIVKFYVFVPQFYGRQVALLAAQVIHFILSLHVRQPSLVLSNKFGKLNETLSVSKKKKTSDEFDYTHFFALLCVVVEIAYVV